MRIAINGFGRIGRTILRQIATSPACDDIELVLINDIAPLETLSYLFRYDSTFGPFPGEATVQGANLCVNGRKIPVSQSADPGALDLAGVDVFLECTGKAKTPEQAAMGRAKGAANVLMSGPCPGAEVTVVMGANDAQMGAHRVVSNASCTTNAMAPLLRLLDDAFELATGHLTTVHCYTNSQPMIDGPRDTLARSRAGALSMVPTTTSATGLVTQVLPHLQGRLSGAALRVPTASVSCVDAVITTTRALPKDLPAWLDAKARSNPVLATTQEPLVSCDLRGHPASLVIALPETKQIGAHQARIFGWYDNEWGFSARMIDMARAMAARG